MLLLESKEYKVSFTINTNLPLDSHDVRQAIEKMVFNHPDFKIGKTYADY